jgi:hypothetical protein
VKNVGEQGRGLTLPIDQSVMDFYLFVFGMLLDFESVVDVEEMKETKALAFNIKAPKNYA